MKSQDRLSEDQSTRPKDAHYETPRSHLAGKSSSAYPNLSASGDYSNDSQATIQMGRQSQGGDTQNLPPPIPPATENLL
jgi:hypothetical protein